MASNRSAPKPSFRQSVGEANETADAIHTLDILQHYEDVAAGIYVWDGLPEDVPDGYIERALFNRAGVAYKVTPTFGPVVTPCKPETWDLYGQPRTWLPDPYGTFMPVNDGSEFFQPSDAPVLWLTMSTESRILPYAEIMSKALKTLGQNITALSQPILISGAPSGNRGDNIDGIMLRSDLSAGQTYIPVVTPGAIGVEVLDLKAQDHTQNLYSVIQACDAMILEIMGASMGPEKSSGVTTLETASGVMPVTMSHDWGLAVRTRWAKKVNAMFGTSISVREGDAWEQVDAQPEEMQQENDDSEGDNGSMETDT